MEIAGYSNISATANLITTTKEGNINTDNQVENAEDKLCKLPNLLINSINRIGKNPEQQKLSVCNIVHNDPSIESPESEKKIYIPTYINNYRVVGCLDSGSDLTILHSSLYHRIKPKTHYLTESDIKYVTTFSNTDIAIEGKFPCKIGLSRAHLGIDVDVYVIPDIPNQTPLLLGNDMLRKGLGKIGYKESREGIYPEITFDYPLTHNCIVFYAAPRELYTCEATCTLGPHETQEIEFRLPPAAPVIRTDHILITATHWSTVSIVPSRSSLEYTPKIHAYTAIAQVVNLSNQTIQTNIRGKFELINTFKTIKINEKNKRFLAKALREHPIGREVLDTEPTANIKIMVPCVNQVTSHNENIQISDLKFDLADTVMSKEPTYSGEGEITEDIFEPHGIDLPTVIYRNA